ncbi:MAG TPA: hypothetical protein VHK47_08595 [Polyangia bacterium]|jgi:hypothetical protein|nr:hypothetical protein [Polyangia bacterium]
MGNSPSPAQNRRRPRASGAIALALAGLWVGGATQAAQPAPAARARPEPAATTGGDVSIVDGGRVTDHTTPEGARRDGLTVIDLSDDWLPYVFSEEPDKPQPLRPYLIDLANGRFRSGSKYARAREDRFFEAFGIFPSLNLVRRRLADRKRHACHERVKDAVLEQLSAKNVIPAEEAEKVPNPDPATAAETPMITTGKTISPRPLTAIEKRAVVAMQAHLRCEELLSGRASPSRMDRRTVEGLKVYQRLQMIADSGNVDAATRAALLGDTREQDFRALLRALRERVVDATGLLEDGSALGVQGTVQGRVLDSEEFRPLPVPGTSAEASPPAEAGGTAAETSAKITPAPDLVAAATQAASQALGWTSPDAVLASTLVAPPAGSRRRKPAARKGPAPLPAAVAIRLPPPPAYHGPKMDLRAEIDRGDVVLERPKLDKDGHKKWKPPVADRPTLTLYARVGDHEVALSRWPTTIGGWKTIQKSDGSMALKYKESITGDALWSEVLATPTWHPAPGMPTRKLLIKQGDTFVPKTEIIGPGYRAAYGLVAMVHHQIVGRDDKGEPELVDYRIRTHGTPGYRSVKRGESNGCHRLHNYLALRLASFLVKHRENVREGLVPEDYVRNVEYKGHKVALESETKGYRFKLTPPVPVTVLDGDVHGNAKAVKRLVPLSVAP